MQPSKFKVLACGRRWGKTDACAVETVVALLQDVPTKHVIIAPTLDQARILFDRVCELLTQVLKIEKSIEKVTIRRSPFPKLTFGEHRLQARSGYLGRALRGHEATHIVIDEAAYLPEETITEVAMPMLATSAGSLTMISTPNGKNHFWKFFNLGQEGLHGVWSRTAPSDESPFVSKNFLSIQQELISDRSFRIEYLAEFLDAQGRVFSSDAIDRSLRARICWPEDAPVVIGIDFGRYRDYSAMAALCGTRDDCVLLQLDRFNRMSGRDQMERIGRFVSQFPDAMIFCDATGVGDALVDQLREHTGRRLIEGIVFTSSLKHQLIDNLAWLFENDAISMEPDPMLIRELSHFESLVTTSGKQRFSAPSGFHDDLVIALALAARGLRKKSQVVIAAAGIRPF